MNTDDDKPLWSSRFEKPPASDVSRLSGSIDFDLRLWAEEIAATRAHALALERAGLLTSQERLAIEGALQEAAAAFDDGSFEPHAAAEDIHSAIEMLLIDRLGEAGARIHAGRSRNDLVVTDLRLWLKNNIPAIARGVHEVEEALYRQSQEHRETLAPGYTHLQHAQPILLPHTLLAHAFALTRDFERVIGAYRRADVSSLGAGALAGTTLPLDPQATASDLGFSKVFENAADAVSDRDFALEFLSAAAILGVHISRLAEDIVLWVSNEFAFASLDDAYATGSSIMPQKKNPDVAELARAKSARITADLMHLLGAMKGLPLTYDRDLQEDKEPVFDAADTLLAVLPAMGGLVQTLSFDRGRLEVASARGGSAATDLAEALVMKGMPFRLAHEEVGRLVARASADGKDLADLTGSDFAAAGDPFTAEFAELLDPRRSVAARQSHGGTSPERIGEQLARLEAIMDDQERWLSGFAAY